MSESRETAECRRETERRENSWRSFVYGNFRPRRRHHRREDDEHRILFDWYEPRVLYLTLGVLLLSCTDALFTLNLLNHGAGEANFLMAAALEHSMERFLAAKISVTGISLVCLVVVVRRKFVGDYSVEHLLQFFFAAYLLVICYEIYIFEFVFDLDILSLERPN